MSVFGHDLPPGCRLRDIGNDVYVCDKCGGGFAEEDLDDDATDGETIVCKGCAVEARSEEAAL